jgi:hypothetical protein
VPDLSVSGDNFDLVGGDPHDPTTTSETLSTNAIAEPTPDVYRPCWSKISLITKINSSAQSKNEQESEASNLNITRRWSSESQRTSCICACSGVAEARCKKTKVSMAAAAEYIWRDIILGLGRPRVGRPQLGPKAHQTGDAAPWQILDVNLFRRLPLTQDEFWHESGAIRSSMKL